MSRIVNHKRLQTKSRIHRVYPLDSACNVWRVVSGESSKRYTVLVYREVYLGAVRFAGARCSCTWGHYRPSRDLFRSGCSHVVAVYNEIAKQEEGRVISAWGNVESAKRQHKPIMIIGDGVILTGSKRQSRTLDENRRLLRGNEDFEDLI